MANVTIYLPADIEGLARKRAKKERLSLSRWVAREIAKTVDENWPAEFLSVAGSCPDFPAAEELRKGYGQDAARERIS